MTDLPWNPSAEAALIGSVLHNNTTFARVRDFINADDFMSLAHREIWQAISDCILSGKVATRITLSEQMERLGSLKEMGGEAYLTELIDCAVFGPEIDDYARMVSDFSLRRHLIEAGRDLSKSAYEGHSGTVMDDHEAAIEALREREGSTNTIDCLQDVTLASLDNQASLLEQLVASQYPSLDGEVGGLEKGAMTVLGARPGMGKTAFAICLVGNMLRAGHTVGFFSLEMPARDIGLRLGCWEAWNTNTGSVPYFSDVKQARAQDQQLNRVKDALAQDHVKRLLVDDRGGLTINAMRRQIRDWKKHCRRMGWPAPSVIVVDHMGHARPDERATGRYEKITEVSNALLSLSKEFDVAVLALCQLNRASVQSRQRPSLEDLRDSGAIEQDASLVLMLHREDYYLEKEAREGDTDALDKLRHEKGHAELIIAKARNGPTGSIPLKHSIGHNVFRDPRWQTERASA